MSQMMEHFYRRIEDEIRRKEAAGEVLVLDAATGAGNCAARVAQMLRRGRLITVDNDPAAWNDYAREKIEKAGVGGRVEFREASIADMACFPDAHFDIIVSGATLSAMGMAMADGISEFGRVAKRGALLAIYDLMPQGRPETPAQKNAVAAWRLAKAIDIFRGVTHYEEISPELVCRRLRSQAFAVEDQRVEEEWEPASEESVTEYLRSEDHLCIEDPDTRAACARLLEKIRKAIREQGMATFSKRYSIFAMKKGGQS